MTPERKPEMRFYRLDRDAHLRFLETDGFRWPDPIPVYPE